MNGMLQCGSKIYPNYIIVRRGVDHPVANNKIVILGRPEFPVLNVNDIDYVAEIVEQFDYTSGLSPILVSGGIDGLEECPDDINQ